MIHNIGIALSGGGIRATIFHLGIFKWLGENKLLEEVKRISTVSGASLCVGMIYAHNDLRWPDSSEFLEKVLPSIEKAIMSKDLQASSLKKLVVSPAYWNKKVNIIAKGLEGIWGVQGKLSQLKGDADWYINCTTYETGKRFRFCRENMGDYTLGYVERPEIPLSEVMAASAGFPILIGPYSLKPESYKWIPSKYASNDWKPPAEKTLHLWDGGIYDNLGMESIFKEENGGTLSKGVDFMIVSNASASIGAQERKSMSVKGLKRLLDISMDQVTALRSRGIMDFLLRTGQGMYLKIGNSAEKITRDSGYPTEKSSQLVKRCMTTQQAGQAMNYPTTLTRPSKEDYQLLLRHGFETAECTYQCYHKQ